MEALQQSLAETLANGSPSPSGSSGNVASYMGQMAMAMGKLGTLEGFLHQANNLRQQTLQQMHRILTTRQSARALLAINDYFSRLRALSSLACTASGMSFWTLSSLPSANSLGRWFGEPVKAAIVHTNSFLTNARGYPCLSKRHQRLVTGFFNHSIQVNCVMELLSKLVSKQLWKMPKLWVGFLKCISQTQPHSFHVLLQLAVTTSTT